VRLDQANTREDKPGSRQELSPNLDIDCFNFNVAVLQPSERLSQNHFHYHERQSELIHITKGRCRVETVDNGFDASSGDTVRFGTGEQGAHLVYNPFDKPCRLVAIGWPPDGRHPVTQVQTTDELLAERK
jgi:uncharacterized cupin superfamily protein